MTESTVSLALEVLLSEGSLPKNVCPAEGLFSVRESVLLLEEQVSRDKPVHVGLLTNLLRDVLSLAAEPSVRGLVREEYVKAATAGNP